MKNDNVKLKIFFLAIFFGLFGMPPHQFMPIKFKAKIVLFILFLAIGVGVKAESSLAATYWVSPTGAASWANCRSEVPLNDGSACSLSSANSNLTAGDTVYLRGGAYTYSGSALYGAIQPSRSGTSSAKIIYKAYTAGAWDSREVPFITASDNSMRQYGIALGSKNYIVISGITFVDFHHFGAITMSSHNELSYCDFYAKDNSNSDGIFITDNYNKANPGSTHNWLHHNIIHNINSAASTACAEGSDAIRIGTSVYDEGVSRNNTIEDNIVYASGHTLSDDFGAQEVWRNNTGHNSGYKYGPPAVYGTASADGNTTKLIDSAKNWVALGVVPFSGTHNGSDNATMLTDTSANFGIAENSYYGYMVNNLTDGSYCYIKYTTSTSISCSARGLDNEYLTGGTTNRWHIGDAYTITMYVHNFTQPKTGRIISASTTINENDTLNFRYVSGAYGSPIFLTGTKYAVGCSYAPDPPGNNPGNGMYSHRNFSISNTDNTQTEKYNLFESNRAGYAGVNPTNNGADGLTLGSPGNIIRYNSFFGNDGPGLNLKGYYGVNSCGARNRIYNNTLYKNGQYVIGNSNPVPKMGLEFYTTNAIGNQIKNNIFYQNGSSSSYLDIGGGGFNYSNQTWANNWCNYNADGCSIKTGDPLFANPDISDVASAILPNLNLQSSSPALNNGSYLTQANGSGSSSTTLIVDDALYFQDGSWGSDLARGVTFFPDWIAIGTFNNTVKISSINYDTNTITLASPMTWNDNDPIWLYKKSDGTVVLSGSAPDMGAYEYQSGSDTTAPSAPSGLSVR